jgi:antitoxin (DNA-binding transcriptional repressor) of toxin-antitoxin stability system
VEKIEVDVNDLPTRFAELLAKATAGDEVVVTAEGKPLAWLNPIPQPGGPRVPGFAKGAFLGMAPDFDAPLPDEFWLGDNP